LEVSGVADLRVAFACIEPSDNHVRRHSGFTQSQFLTPKIASVSASRAARSGPLHEIAGQPFFIIGKCAGSVAEVLILRCEKEKRGVKSTHLTFDAGTPRLNVAADCKIAATHRRLAMRKPRKHDFGGSPWTGKPKRDTSRLEDASAKQRKQHAHKAPVRRAASKFRG
jgi:hypothetical protein